ncbi:MAG TPA: hypothetical protein VH393_01500 [Ktedonobacterales bacterium]
MRWAPRVSLTKIRKLYQTDALGIVNEELIDEVGFALYSRCRSILTVTEAAAGRIACPQCEALIIRQSEDPTELLRCATCGWETTWERYHQTWRHQELYGGGGVDAFLAYVQQWPRAGTPQQKVLFIDQLIHIWHWQARSDHLLGRATVVNLIESSCEQAIALLDEITYGPNSAEAMRETKVAWRADGVRVREGQRRVRNEDSATEM